MATIERERLLPPELTPEEADGVRAASSSALHRGRKRHKANQPSQFKSTQRVERHGADHRRQEQGGQGKIDGTKFGKLHGTEGGEQPRQHRRGAGIWTTDESALFGQQATARHTSCFAHGQRFSYRFMTMPRLSLVLNHSAKRTSLPAQVTFKGNWRIGFLGLD